MCGIVERVVSIVSVGARIYILELCHLEEALCRSFAHQVSLGRWLDVISSHLTSSGMLSQLASSSASLSTLTDHIITLQGLLFCNISKETFNNCLNWSRGSVWVAKSSALINWHIWHILCTVQGIPKPGINRLSEVVLLSGSSCLLRECELIQGSVVLVTLTFQGLVMKCPVI